MLEMCCMMSSARSRRRFGASILSGRLDPGYNWVRQGELDEGERRDGLTTETGKEMSRLKRENKRLRMERDILKRAAAWFARESGSIPGGGTRS